MEPSAAVSLRSWWMSTLAQSSQERLESQVLALGPLPPYELIRPPEIGLATVQGRAGGTGQRFVLGEVSISRCVLHIRDHDGQESTGFGYVQGRLKRQAELVALCDGLLQLTRWQERLVLEVVDPLFHELEQRRRERWQQTAATKVEFFTLVREQS